MTHELPAPYAGNAAYERTTDAKAVSNSAIPKSRMCGPQVRFCERDPWETRGPYSTQLQTAELDRAGCAAVVMLADSSRPLEKHLAKPF